MIKYLSLSRYTQCCLFKSIMTSDRKRQLKIFLFLILAIPSPLYLRSQTKPNRTEVQQAHDLKGKVEEFSKSENGIFQAKVYTVKTPLTNKTHHWFVQVIDQNMEFVNYGNVSLNAYHEQDKNRKLNYMAPVFPMCQEGKYVVGFINEKMDGNWILELDITQHGKNDKITLQMELAENLESLK